MEGSTVAISMKPITFGSPKWLPRLRPVLTWLPTKCFTYSLSKSPGHDFSHMEAVSPDVLQSVSSFADQGFGLSPEFDVVLSSGNDETPMPPTHADLTHGFAINPQAELS